MCVIVVVVGVCVCVHACMCYCCVRACVRACMRVAGGGGGEEERCYRNVSGRMSKHGRINRTRIIKNTTAEV